MKPIAIYLHVPFCARKCAYCDFASFAGREDDWEKYFAALSGEIDAWAERLRGYEARSVFFGGGTPSLVPATYIAETIKRLRGYVRFAPGCEITLEANPGTLNADKLRIYRDSGVNRLSIGVQSFDAELLRMLGRIHTPEQAELAVAMARDAGFANISLDLMYALPGQSMEAWAATLDKALSLPVAHLSAYSLIVEDGTEMARRVTRGEAAVPDDDAVNEMQRYAVKRLANAGFMRYEISNFARPGFESRHNLTYWDGGEYLGLGSAAHSLMNNCRFANPPELDRYLAGERMLDRTERSVSDRKEEALMLATRTVRGLDLNRWRAEFGESLEEARGREIRKLENYGLIEIADGFLRLTPAGLELQDSVVLELMEE